MLAKPSEIATSFVENFSVIWGAGLRTLVEAVGGLLIGVALGVAVALAAARWIRLRQGLVPIATVASAIPIVAVAPIMNQWFTITSPFSKMMVVSVMVFFPVMVNTLRGLTEVDHGQIEMMHSLRLHCPARSSPASGSRRRCRTSSAPSRWRRRSP